MKITLFILLVTGCILRLPASAAAEDAGTAGETLLAQATTLPVFPTPPPRRPRPVPPLNGTNNPAVTGLSTNNPLSALIATNKPAGARAGTNAAALPPAGTRGANTNALAGADGDAAAAAEQIIPAGQIDFPAVSLDQVLAIYAELVGRTVLHATLPAVVINLKTQTPLTKTEAIQAFNTVLAMNGITMINVGEKFVKAVPMAQAQLEAAPFTTTDEKQLPEADEYVTHIVQLKYVKPSELVPVLTPLAKIPGNVLAVDGNQMLIIRDYAANVKRMLELIRKIDINYPSEFEQEVIPIKYAQASDISSALSSLGSGTGGTSIGSGSSVGRGGAGGARGGLGAAGGLGAGGYGGAGGLGGLNNTPGSTGLNNQPGALGGANNAGGRSQSFANRLNSIVQRAANAGDFQILGMTKIIADQRTNSLLVFANKQDMAMIKKIVAELDIVLAQVLIEAIIMEVNLDSGHSVGVSTLQSSPSTPGKYFSGIGAINNGAILNPSSFTSLGTNAASALPGGFSYLANFGNDFQATVTAIANDSRINVLSRPQIQTSHGVAANIQVGQSVPEVTGTYFGGINGAASSQYQQQFVGISLQVTPLINPDGLVVMDINENVQQLGPNYTIDGNPVPSTTQRSAQATVSVKDRDTIILGGMIQTTHNKSNSGVPFLKDIPGLGVLFRSGSVDNQRVELIILIRPTVLPSPEAAALVAKRQLSRMPGVKTAQAEEQADENQRLKEAEKITVPAERP